MRTTSCYTLTVSSIFCGSELVTDCALALVTGQLGRDLAIISREVEKLYGVLEEEDLMLQ
jgi:hypothetical protein